VIPDILQDRSFSCLCSPAAAGFIGTTRMFREQAIIAEIVNASRMELFHSRLV
jgi:hypothetical protein